VTAAGQWYSKPGGDADVVVSSRTRLARNLLGYPFPLMLNREQEEQLQQEVVKAFSGISDAFEIVYLDRIPPLDRKILLERNLISQEFSVSPHKLVLYNEDETLSAMVNEEDHLRLAAIKSGLCLEEVLAVAEDLDTRLEDHIHYAASIEWGYLNASIHNLGTGLRASVMLHLPALVMDGNIGWALKRTSQMGLQIKGYWGDGDNSLGDMYQVSNQVCLGMSEKEIVGGLKSVATDLVSYERNAREEMMGGRRMEVEDRIYRAFGVLSHCRMISSKEAIGLLGMIRLGVSLGFLDRPSLEVITALMILSQKAHIQKMLDTADDETDNKLVDYTRARLIRRALEEGNV
jgi:protein arginine kinase